MFFFPKLTWSWINQTDHFSSALLLRSVKVSQHHRENRRSPESVSAARRAVEVCRRGSGGLSADRKSVRFWHFLCKRLQLWASCELHCNFLPPPPSTPSTSDAPSPPMWPSEPPRSARSRLLRWKNDNRTEKKNTKLWWTRLAQISHQPLVYKCLLVVSGRLETSELLKLMQEAQTESEFLLCVVIYGAYFSVSLLITWRSRSGGSLPLTSTTCYSSPGILFQEQILSEPEQTCSSSQFWTIGTFSILMLPLLDTVGHSAS